MACETLVTLSNVKTVEMVIYVIISFCEMLMRLGLIHVCFSVFMRNPVISVCKESGPGHLKYFIFYKVPRSEGHRMLEQQTLLIKILIKFCNVVKSISINDEKFLEKELHCSEFRQHKVNYLPLSSSITHFDIKYFAHQLFTTYSTSLQETLLYYIVSQMN